MSIAFFTCSKDISPGQLAQIALPGKRLFQTHSQQVGFVRVRSVSFHRRDALVCLRRSHQRLSYLRDLEVADCLDGDCRRSILLLAVAFTSRVLPERLRTVLVRCHFRAILRHLVFSQICVGKSRILRLTNRCSQRRGAVSVPLRGSRSPARRG